MFGQIVEVVLSKNVYVYKAKSTPRLKEFCRQLHSAYNCQMTKFVADRFRLFHNE